MTELADVVEVRVPQAVLTEGYEFMRSAGRMRLEGMVFWLGRQHDTTFEVTQCIVPRQTGLRTPDGVCAVVEAEELRRLNMYMYRNGLELIAQVHSHPTDAYHSETDDQYAVANTVGCFSIVVPNFAEHDYPLAQCAVYRIDEHGQWNEVDESAHPNRITVV